MDRMQFLIPREQREALKALSRDTGAPVGELIRRAIRRYLAEQPRKRPNELHDPLLRFSDKEPDDDS